MTTVLVVDDQSLIRQAVTSILSDAKGIEVIGHAENGLQAIELARTLRPDVVLMDIRMPDLDGIGATAEICADPELSAVRVLILTTFEEDEYLVAALRAGASGFIGKGAEPEEIVYAVRAVHAGDTLLSPAATRDLIEKYVLATPPIANPVKMLPQKFALLTEREREVLLLVARGRSNQEIANEFVISPHTVKTHVNRIMTKLSAHDRAQLVVFVYEHGLIAPGAS
ncbi:MAG: response regulator [Leucobacter sp.]